MTKYDDFIIDYVMDVQATPGCTTPEMDLRAAMMEEFKIGSNWAWELIRIIVKQHPQLYLEKVMVEYGDGKGRVHPDWEIKWLE
jgi:hypothetical protein